jgi:5'/3'-nucleotidase
MRILLTNDDGIQSPGLEVLEKIAGELTDDVWVVAPEIDNSGASHSLTLAEPLRLRDLGNRHYGVKGTPTDCVIMGVRFLLKDKPPQLVISGVNRGQNLAAGYPIYGDESRHRSPGGRARLWPAALGDADVLWRGIGA